MPTVEFHCHTSASKDSLTSPERLVAVCREKGIDRVIITDHNSVSGARAAQTLDPERVIVGEEIMTTRGELLAAFVVEQIPAGLSPTEAISRLREQGAFISVSHPFDVLRPGRWKRSDLLEITSFVDAIEVYNSRCLLPGFNHAAANFAAVNGLQGTVGSDAHTTSELGRSVLILEDFADADDLRRVIRSARSRVRWSPPWVRLSSRYATIAHPQGKDLDAG
jgi:hypothetical protein